MSAPRGMPGAPPPTWRLTDSWLLSGRGGSCSSVWRRRWQRGRGLRGRRVGGWRLGPPRAELRGREGERRVAGGRGGCCHGLVIAAAPARVSPGQASAPHRQPLSRGHGLVRGRGSCGGGGRGLGAVALGEGRDHLPARRADPRHRPGRAAQRDPRGPGGRRHRLGGERGCPPTPPPPPSD